MRKNLIIIFLISPLNLFAVEKTKEEKVAKYVLENIQKELPLWTVAERVIFLIS